MLFARSPFFADAAEAGSLVVILAIQILAQRRCGDRVPTLSREAGCLWFVSMARIPLRGHGCQNKKSLVHSLGDGRGDRPRSTLHMSWPVLRSTLTASSSRRWPHSPATHVAPSLRRYVNVGAGGGETVKHTGGGQHKTGQSAATAWHTAAFCLQVTMLRFSHLDLTPASISPDAKACYEPVTATSPCGVSVVSPSHTQYRGRADGVPGPTVANPIEVGAVWQLPSATRNFVVRVSG